MTPPERTPQEAMERLADAARSYAALAEYDPGWVQAVVNDAELVRSALSSAPNPETASDLASIADVVNGALREVGRSGAQISGWTPAEIKGGVMNLLYEINRRVSPSPSPVREWIEGLTELQIARAFMGTGSAEEVRINLLSLERGQGLATLRGEPPQQQEPSEDAIDAARNAIHEESHDYPGDLTMRSALRAAYTVDFSVSRGDARPTGEAE